MWYYWVLISPLSCPLELIPNGEYEAIRVLFRPQLSNRRGRRNGSSGRVSFPNGFQFIFPRLVSSAVLAVLISNGKGGVTIRSTFLCMGCMET